MDKMRQRLIAQPGVALVILLGSFFFFLCVFSLLSGLLMPKFSDQVAALRIFTILQAIFLFVMPALITAMTATRLPARMLEIDSRPRLMTVLLVCMVMMMSVPAMNWVVQWNASIHLPESMAEFESYIRAMEDAAAESVNMLMGGTSVGALVVSLLIVGVFAGFSEELFFRGALQNILGAFRMNRHVAIWLAAVIFSAMHMQFYGFVPRMLLGAFFGYLLYWSGSLWLPIVAHAFNNSLATLVSWMNRREVLSMDMDTVGAAPQSAGDWTLLIASVAVTVLGIIVIRRVACRDNSGAA